MLRKFCMDPQIEKYTRKLIRDRTADPASIRFYRLDDVMISGREDEWAPVFAEVFSGLNATALLLARPALRFADLLVAAAEPGTDRLSPQDNETRTFFHDIPFVRKAEWSGDRKNDLAGRIVQCLKERKAAVVEGLGLIGLGGVTIEQAYIAYSTLFHTTFLKFCLDILERGFRNKEERTAFDEMRHSWARRIDMEGVSFNELRNKDRSAIYDEICKAGRYTVEKGLVDSFFGNISWFDGKTIYISQTASSLDELVGHIDPVPLDNTSTAGLSASSELPAHRAIYQSSGYHAVLHGHPKFSIILSMHCEEKDCKEKDCGRNCKRKRAACGVPIVSGEIGAGGLAKTVPGAIRENGICIVHGHGVFSAGETGFRDAFRKMVECENRCREEYFRMVEERTKKAAETWKKRGP